MNFLLTYAVIGLMVWIAASIVHGDEFSVQIQDLSREDEDVGEVGPIASQFILLISFVLFWPALVARLMK